MNSHNIPLEPKVNVLYLFLLPWLSLRKKRSLEGFTPHVDRFSSPQKLEEEGLPLFPPSVPTLCPPNSVPPVPQCPNKARLLPVDAKTQTVQSSRRSMWGRIPTWGAFSTRPHSHAWILEQDSGKAGEQELPSHHPESCFLVGQLWDINP